MISRVLPGLEADLESDLVFILPASSFQPARRGLALKEGFPAASRATQGSSGQNVPTRVQIQVVGLPEGVSVIFPGSVTSSVSDATLSVLEGSETGLSAGDENLSVMYEFSPEARISDQRVETFQFDYTVKMETPDVESTDGSPPQGGPVVAEPPPYSCRPHWPPARAKRATEIRVFRGTGRNLSRLRPNFHCRNSKPIFRSTLVPGPLKFQFTNRRDLDLAVHLEALGPDGDRVSGPGITNPASVAVDRGDQVSVALEEVFGTGILDAGTGTVAALTRRADIGAIFLLGDDQTLSDAGRARQPARKRFLLSNISREGEEPFTVCTFSIHRKNSAPRFAQPFMTAPGWWCLRPAGPWGRGGRSQRVPRPSLPSLWRISKMGTSRALQPGEGVVAIQMFGNEETVNHLAAQATPCGSNSMESPTSLSGAALRQNSTLSTATSRRTQSFAFRFSTIKDKFFSPR